MHRDRECGDVRWRSGQVAVGGWCATGQPFAAELIAQQGFDFVLLDNQHGLNAPESLLQCLAAVEGNGSAPIVAAADRAHGQTGGGG